MLPFFAHRLSVADDRHGAGAPPAPILNLRLEALSRGALEAHDGDT